MPIQYRATNIFKFLCVLRPPGLIAATRSGEAAQKLATPKHDNLRKEGAEVDAMLKKKETSRQKMDSNIGSK